MAYHQHMIDDVAEIRPSAPVYREIYEELFYGLERPPAPSLKHDWFFDDCESLRWLRERHHQTAGAASDPAVRIECTSFGTNLIHGTYNISVLVAVHDEEFWR